MWKYSIINNTSTTTRSFESYEEGLKTLDNDVRVVLKILECESFLLSDIVEFVFRVGEKFVAFRLEKI